MITIDGMPQMSAILSGLFKQLQMAALLTEHFETAPSEPAKSFLERFGLRPSLLDSIFTAVDQYMPNSVSMTPVPAISNHARWSSSEILGGYLSVKPGELLASYLGCWQQAADDPEACPFRFPRLAFWYWRETGDVLTALGLLFDLNKAGFFLHLKHFWQAVFMVCDAYTQDFNVKLLQNHDFKSQSGDQDLALTVQGLSGRPHNTAKVQAVVEWVTDCAIEEAQRAREATTSDEWLFQQPILRAAVEILTSLDRKHKALLTVSQRAVASQFEEVRADLGGAAMVTGLVARERRPLRIEYYGVTGVGLEYQRTYGAEWLDKLLEDRVLLPEALRDHFALAYAGATLPAFREVEVPVEWRYVSEWMAWSFAVALKKDPVVLRSRDFDIETIYAKCREMGFEAEEDTEDPGIREFSSEAQSEARHELTVDELTGLLQSPEVFSDNDAAAMEKLQTIISLYPWNNFARQELGIRYDQSGNVAEGFAQLRASVLLDPTYGLTWQSLSVVLNRLGNRQDSMLAAAMAEMILQKEGP